MSPALTVEKRSSKPSNKPGRKKLEGLRDQGEFKSVTSVLTGDEEKREREERVFVEPEAASPWGGKDLGSFTHLLLEKGWDWDKARLEKAALFYGEKMGIPQLQAEEAAGWVEKTLRSEIIQKARGSGKVFRELPITGRQADGSYLNAVLDLAFLEEDQWVIVDYKSDQNQGKKEKKSTGNNWASMVNFWKN